MEKVKEVKAIKHNKDKIINMISPLYARFFGMFIDFILYYIPLYYIVKLANNRGFESTRILLYFFVSLGVMFIILYDEWEIIRSINSWDEVRYI